MHDLYQSSQSIGVRFVPYTGIFTAKAVSSPITDDTPKLTCVLAPCSIKAPCGAAECFQPALTRLAVHPVLENTPHEPSSSCSR